jgi:hypothetical protein
VKIFKKIRKIGRISSRRGKNSQKIPNFLCGKNNKSCPKKWMMSLCVSFLWMVDNVTMCTYWAIPEEDGVMSLQVIHFASACFAIIRLHICPKYHSVQWDLLPKPASSDSTANWWNPANQIKPKAPKKGEYKEQNGRTHTSSKTKEPTKRANHKGNITFPNTQKVGCSMRLPWRSPIPVLFQPKGDSLESRIKFDLVVG